MNFRPALPSSRSLPSSHVTKSPTRKEVKPQPIDVSYEFNSSSDSDFEILPLSRSPVRLTSPKASPPSPPSPSLEDSADFFEDPTGNINDEVICSSEEESKDQMTATESTESPGEQITQTSQSELPVGWSTARKEAWALRKSNPNAYFYRFNEQGEEPKFGPWDEQEKQLFLKRFKDVGISEGWGHFARGIPGRVGYQCASFYRQLFPGEAKTRDNRKLKQADLSRFFSGVSPPRKVDHSHVPILRIPNPLPLSWARRFLPFEEPSSTIPPHSSYKELPLESLSPQTLGTFAAILLDPPWSRPDCEGITPMELKEFSLGRFVENGYMFLWVEKEFLSQVKL